MKVVGSTYSCLVIIGQNIIEQTRTTTERELERLESELAKPVGERNILKFEGEKLTCLVDLNVSGLSVQVITKRDFEGIQQQKRLASGGFAAPQKPQGL